MTEPVQTNPLKPLAVAARWSFAVGLFLLAFTLFLVISFFIEWHPRSGRAMTELATMLTGATVYVVAGSLFCTCGRLMRRKKFLPILVALVLSGLIVCVLAASLVLMIADANSHVPTASMLLGMAFCGVMLAVFAYGIVLLIKAYSALKNDPSAAHGFEPILPAPAHPTVSDREK